MAAPPVRPVAPLTRISVPLMYSLQGIRAYALIPYMEAYALIVKRFAGGGCLQRLRGSPQMADASPKVTQKRTQAAEISRRRKLARGQRYATCMPSSAPRDRRARRQPHKRRA